MQSFNEIYNRLKNTDNSFIRELYGNDENILKEKLHLYSQLLHKFQDKYQHNEGDIFSAPGRTEIGGNHTDHQHGRVLAGAVNMDNIAVATPNQTDLIRITSEGYPEIKVDLNSLSIRKEKFYLSEALVSGICARLIELGYQVGGFDAYIIGGVPDGSGLSSSASFEVLMGAIISHLFNNGELDAVENAKIGQWAENNYFGKPCGLMDQTACSVGGFITIDFNNPSKPVVKSVNFDFMHSGYTLVITDTGGSHADLNEEYASLPNEMRWVAKEFGKEVLRQVTQEELLSKISQIRSKTGDRAILRTLHFLGDNQRVVDQVNALEANNFEAFLSMVNESGRSSYMYNQNVYCNFTPNEQGISLALALSEIVLKGKGAWRVHGGGFAGTIQAFVPDSLLDEYIQMLESAFGVGKCHKLFIRNKGAVKVEL